MRLAALLMLLILLTGCAPAGPAPTEETTLPPQTTAVPTTLPPETTQPPDPMELLLQALTVEEKVGQLFLARCPETGAMEDLARYHLGGYLLFGRDFEGHTPDTLRFAIDAWQQSAPVPLLIAVDEEGGTVTRVSRYPAFRSAPFPSPRALYDAGGMEAVLNAEKEKAQLLTGLGINVAMGPVCDIATEPSAFLYRRSLGQNPEETGRFAANTVTLYRSSGLGSVLKHFPGYGSNADTHTGIAVDDRTLAQLEKADLVPFRSGIDAGCHCILVSHTVVTALDDALPASLSPAVHDYLRDTLGFTGVVMTDDLVMQAITDTYGAEEAAVLAVLAGNDLLCSTEYAVQYGAVLSAVQEGRIPEDLLDTAVMRVLQWKRDLGLIF